MISTTIKKEYMELILKGEKKVEYKPMNKYWTKRIGEPTIDTLVRTHKVINFLCGRKSYKFEINFISIDFTPKELHSLIGGLFCYHIHLGERIEDTEIEKVKKWMKRPREVIEGERIGE